MPIRVTCTKCHTRFHVSEQFAGKEGPCPKCKTLIRVPNPEEAVVIEAPKPKGPVDSTGKSVLKPIRRKETKLSSVQITLIASSVIVFLVVAIILRLTVPPSGDVIWWVILSAAAFVLAVPLSFVAYTFLRDQEREGFWSKELWVRVLICSAVYAVTWIAMPIAYAAFYDSYEIGSYITAGVAMFGFGTVAAMFCFEFDWLIGTTHYGLYMGTCLIGRWIAGVGAVPTTAPSDTPTTTTTTTTTQLLEMIPAVDSIAELGLMLSHFAYQLPEALIALVQMQVFVG